ncbi:hypothetical protein K1W54_14190, partial [Micromonospora sp. CPCC 205371]|nr:hypothetical protein [Micromonospora sp. CPCC 205371]
VCAGGAARGSGGGVPVAGGRGRGRLPPGSGVVARQPNGTDAPAAVADGDIRTMSISAQYANRLTDEQLAANLRVLERHIPTLPPAGAEYETARENQRILQNEQVRRLVEGPGVSTSDDTVPARHARFKQAVLLSAQHRMLENQQNLDQWRGLIETQFSAPALQTHVLAQSAEDLRATAQQTGGMRAYEDWAGERNPYRRNVQEHQARGEWRACTGCHEMVRADELARHEPHMGPAWTSPADRLSPAAGLPPGSGDPFGLAGTASARLQAAVDAIRPVVAPLGDQGYRIIPDDVFSLRSGMTAEQLRTVILAKIAERRSAYEELKTKIAEGDISYLQLVPILQELLPKADPEVRQAVADEQAAEHTWSIVKIGGTIILALLSLLFPPLALAVAALQFHSGYESFQQGRNYMLGTGANNVFTREQQDAGGAMVASGVLNMGMAVATVAAVAPGALDMAATRAITASDMAIAQRIAQRALAGPVPEAELLQLQQAGLVGRMGQGWANTRGFQVLYRGQGAPTAELLSPAARAGGVEASQNLYNTMKAQGLTDVEIAGYTARWNAEPVPAFDAPAGLGGQPLGSVGIPTTRLPNVAADFAQGPTGVIYVLRVPKNLPVSAAEVGWGAQSAIEQEWVVFHQLPNGTVVRVMEGNVVPPLRYDAPPGVGPSLTVPPRP